MPTWNSRKSRDATNRLSKTSVHNPFRESRTGSCWLWIQRGEHDGTANTVIKFSQRHKMKWQSVHFLKDSNFIDQGQYPILGIRRLTTCVIVRQFREKMRRLRLNWHNLDTKTTCWMRSTSRSVKNSSMSGICNQITNLDAPSVPMLMLCRSRWSSEAQCLSPNASLPAPSSLILVLDQRF